MTLKKTRTLSLTAALTLAMASIGAPAFAQAKPDNEVTANAALTSDYRYRGISQTRLKPALQAGVDYVNNPSGFYLGAWGSTIKWIKDAGGDTGVELDFYGGKRGEAAPGLSYDVGGLYYLYPSNGLNPSANTFELYGQLGYGPAYVKYSHATTNLFGTGNSKQSGYLDVGANVDLGSGYTLNLHAGHQKVRNNSALSYTDYKVGVTKDLGVCAVSLALVGTDIDVFAPNGKNLGKSGAVLSVSKTF
jgi:uncharacterized protein (TIGR02001 family)